MKKATILFAFLIGMILNATAQKDSSKPKQDTVIQVLLPLDQYRALLYTLDQVIDSKNLSKQVFELFGRSASIYQPADKPKEPAKAPEKEKAKKQ